MINNFIVFCNILLFSFIHVYGLFKITLTGNKSMTAFYARVDTTPNTVHADNERIVFGHVVTNDAGAYNVTSGIFTAPSVGTYAFSVILTTRTVNSYIEVSIIRQSANLVEPYGFVFCPVISSGSTTSSASGFFVIPLNKDDQVWVQLDKDHYTPAFEFYALETTFAGFVIN